MVRECPKCRLANPPTAEQCDCGYEFATGRISSPPVQRQARSAAVWLLVPTGFLLGALLGGPVYGRIFGVSPELAALGDLIVGTLWGTLIGGAIGTIAAVLLR